MNTPSKWMYKMLGWSQNTLKHILELPGVNGPPSEEVSIRANVIVHPCHTYKQPN